MATINFGELKEIRLGTGTSPVTERKIVSILKVLSESSEPLGSITIAWELERHGIFLSERAVRFYLRITDERGYTQSRGHFPALPLLTFTIFSSFLKLCYNLI